MTKNTWYKIIFFPLLLLLINSCQPQTTVNNEQISIHDSLYLNAKHFLYTNPNLSRDIIQKNLTNGSITDSIRWYNFYDLLIKSYISSSKFDTAIYLSNKALEFCNKKTKALKAKHILLSKIYNNIGASYGFVGQIDSAQKYFKKSMKYALETHQNKQLITSSNNLADCYIHSGNYVKGASQYQQSLSFADSLQLPLKNYTHIYLGLGQTYNELRNFNLSLRYYQKIYERLNRIKLNQQIMCLNGLGNLYYFKKEFNKSLTYFKQGYELIANSSEKAFTQNLLKLNMGEIYLLLGKTDSAEIHIIPAVQYFQKNNNSFCRYHGKTLTLGLAIEKEELVKANQIYQSMKNESSPDPSLISLRNKYLQYYFKKIKNYPLAFHYWQKSAALEDSVRNERIKMQVNEMQYRYRQNNLLAKQKLFIEKQKSEMETLEVRTFLWITISFFIILILFYTYINQKRKRKLQQIQYRNNITRLRLENIRNRISPHFTFNLLNRVLSNYKETEPAHQILFNLIKIMRLNLLLVEKSCIPLQDELDFVQTYLSLEKERFDQTFHYTITVDSSVNIKQITLPSMIIQIPVENSIKHGLLNKDGEKELLIHISKTDSGTYIKIEDNGLGFNPIINNHNPQSTKIGLKVVTQTIQLLNANNTNKITFQIKNKKNIKGQTNGCITNIFLPEEYRYSFPEEK